MGVRDAITVADIVGEDVIDSRELIELRETLESWCSDEDRDAEAYETCDVSEMIAAIQEFEDAGVPDWRYGETFIRDSYFEGYARDLAESIGSVPKDGTWPTSYIDWDAACDALKMDYTAVEVNGVTFWARA